MRLFSSFSWPVLEFMQGLNVKEGMICCAIQQDYDLVTILSLTLADDGCVDQSLLARRNTPGNFADPAFVHSRGVGRLV